VKELDAVARPARQNLPGLGSSCKYLRVTWSVPSPTSGLHPPFPLDELSFLILQLAFLVI
jgi:hypothetical protein